MSDDRNHHHHQKPPHACICTPTSHVPRPRNAFILYRQHHHSIVVAENPGKTNPEISKIIGEKWRSLPQNEKDVWIQLGDEEKKSHLVRFPDYRYQPRRNNKKGSQPTICPVCKGITPAGQQQQQQQQQQAQQAQQQAQQQSHHQQPHQQYQQHSASAANSPTGSSPSPLPQQRSHSATSSPYQGHQELFYRPPGSMPVYYPHQQQQSGPNPYYRFSLPIPGQQIPHPPPPPPPQGHQIPGPPHHHPPHPPPPPPPPGGTPTASTSGASVTSPHPHQHPHSNPHHHHFPQPQPLPPPPPPQSGSVSQGYEKQGSTSSNASSLRHMSGGSTFSSISSASSRSGSNAMSRSSMSSIASPSDLNLPRPQELPPLNTQGMRSPVTTPPLSDYRKGAAAAHSPSASGSSHPWPFNSPVDSPKSPASPAASSTSTQPPHTTTHQATTTQHPTTHFHSHSHSHSGSANHHPPPGPLSTLQEEEYRQKKRRTSSYHDPLGPAVRGERYQSAIALVAQGGSSGSNSGQHQTTHHPLPPIADSNKLTVREKADILSMMCESTRTENKLIAIEGSDKELIKRVSIQLGQKLDSSSCSGLYCSELVQQKPASLTTNYAVNMWRLSCLHQLVSDIKQKYTLLGGYLMDIADDLAAAHQMTTWGYRDRWVNGINLLQGLRGPDVLVYLQEPGGLATQGEVTVAELKGGVKMLIIMAGEEEDKIIDKIYDVVK